jgi:cytochrome b561
MLESLGAFPEPIKARRPPFDALTMALHWATVLLVLGQFTTAWLHGLAEVRQSDFTPILILMHRSLGTTVWILSVSRLAWRLTAAKLPPFPSTMTRLHRVIVKSNEWMLYVLLMGQPVTGLLTTLFIGRAFDLFLWEIPPLLPRNELLANAFHAVHGLGGWALAVVAIGHAAAALFHHFVLRDDVLACMAPIVAEAPAATDARLSRQSTVLRAIPGDDGRHIGAVQRMEGQ